MKLNLSQPKETFLMEANYSAAEPKYVECLFDS